MGNNIAKFILHTVVLLILQLVIMDNIQIGSYVHINIYVMILLIAGPGFHKTHVLLMGFFLGLFMDYQTNTLGIHAASMTLTGYVLPYLRKYINKKPQEEDWTSSNFIRYLIASAFIFNTTFMFIEAMSLQNLGLTLIRILCSTLISSFFMIAYYLIVIAKNHKE